MESLGVELRRPPRGKRAGGPPLPLPSHENFGALSIHDCIRGWETNDTAAQGSGLT